METALGSLSWRQADSQVIIIMAKALIVAHLRLKFSTSPRSITHTQPCHRFRQRGGG